MNAWSWHFLLWTIIAALAVAAILVRLTKYSRNLKNQPPGTTASKIQQIMAGILSLVIPVGMLWFLYTADQDEIRRQQEIAARPHTVRILGYQITFPSKIPPGYEGGTIDVDYSNDWDDGKEGNEGRTRSAQWWIDTPGGTPNDGGIEFMVNELAQPGYLPTIWRKPPEWEKIVRTQTGIKEIAGLQFAISQVQGEVYDSGDQIDAQLKSEKQTGRQDSYKQFLPAHGIPISSIEYLAKDNGKIIGIRAYGRQGKEAAIPMAESVLNTFQKFESKLGPLPKGKDITDVQANGSMIMGYAGDYKDLKDPAVQWFK